METFRLSSKLRENDREYLIQTANDIEQGTVSTTVFVDGVRADTFSYPHPNDVAADQLLALVKQTHGERKRDMENLLKAYQQVSMGSDPDAMYRLATTFYCRRLYREAAELLGRLNRVESGYHQAYNLLGMTRVALGESAEAVNSAAEAVRLRPGYADYRNNLGEALLSAGAAAEAITEFEAAIAINMYYGDAYFNLGLARTLEASYCNDPNLRRQLGSRIVDHFRKAALIQPELESQTQYREGLTALSNFDYSGALVALKRVRESRREAKRQEFVAANRRLMTPRDSWTTEAIVEQIRILQTQLSQHPNYIDLQTELVRCYFEQADLVWERGVEECRRILEAHPDASHMAEARDRAQMVRQSMAQIIAGIGRRG
ncbi:MAG: hypothetical protein AB1772_08565 [Candidatus Zixiibacteriota bacterium]